MERISKPQRIGQYVLGRTLESGTFTKVKCAQHVSSMKPVAIKIIDKKAMEMAGKRLPMRTRKQLDLLRQISHPHVVKQLDVIETPSHLHIVMEFVGGGDLFEYVDKNGSLKEEVARRIFQQLISGLSYCHGIGIAHRDLKPENIMLDDSKNNIKIADFGFSSFIKDGDLFRTSCGSLHYAAPEVISGSMYTGPEADIWSAGVVLFVMLTLRLPFAAENETLLFEQIQTGQYTLPKSLSESVRRLLRGLLRVNPARRLTIKQIRQSKWFRTGLPTNLLFHPSSSSPSSTTTTFSSISVTSNLQSDFTSLALSSSGFGSSSSQQGEKIEKERHVRSFSSSSITDVPYLPIRASYTSTSSSSGGISVKHPSNFPVIFPFPHDASTSSSSSATTTTTMGTASADQSSSDFDQPESAHGSMLSSTRRRSRPSSLFLDADEGSDGRGREGSLAGSPSSSSASNSSYGGGGGGAVGGGGAGTSVTLSQNHAIDEIGRWSVGVEIVGQNPERLMESLVSLMKKSNLFVSKSVDHFEALVYFSNTSSSMHNPTENSFERSVKFRICLFTISPSAVVTTTAAAATAASSSSSSTLPQSQHNQDQQRQHRGLSRVGVSSSSSSVTYSSVRLDFALLDGETLVFLDAASLLIRELENELHEDIPGFFGDMM